MVAAADPHAVRAAYQVLEKGGNAADAAIAAQWVLNVVEPQSSGLGGGGFFLYYEASSKRIFTFDGREKAPAEAYPEMFLNKDGKPCVFKDCATGGRPVGVPGTLKLLYQVYGRFSQKKLSFGELFEPAIQIADEGFPVSKRLAHFIDKEKGRLKQFEASRSIFLKNGRPLEPGYILQEPDLAATFRLIQKKGPAVFYEGEIAEDIVDAVRHTSVHPGSMKLNDLKYYEVKERDPVAGHYRGYDIFSMGPPSSGGTTLIEALNILENYPLGSLGRTADGMHVFIEAQKLAFQDRNEYLGDPDFTRVPVAKLLSKAFAHDREQSIRMDKALPPGDRPAIVPPIESNYTTHICVVDQWGNMASFTTTIEDIFGSAMMVPGRGFFLNNELTDFDLSPKNEKGKLKSNAPEGEKRPRSSMTPVLVFKEGRPVLVVGSPGGSKIIGIVLNVVVNVLDFGMPLQAAVNAPRVVNRAGAVEMEPLLFDNEKLRGALQKRGHSIENVEPFGNVEAIYFDGGSGFIIGASDSRGEGEAMGQ